MTKTKHPQDRRERIKLREKKRNKKEDGATGEVRRRAKNSLREKEAEDEITIAINN